ncbi:hypothetical protein CsSME_00037691 [Camellia sinensis var. sinensis]
MSHVHSRGISYSKRRKQCPDGVGVQSTLHLDNNICSQTNADPSQPKAQKKQKTTVTQLDSVPNKNPYHSDDCSSKSCDIPGAFKKRNSLGNLVVSLEEINYLKLDGNYSILCIGMFSAKSARLRRRLIFLGDRSYEFEKGLADAIGRRRVDIVERGQGVRQAIELFGAEIKWVADQMRKASKMNTVGVFLGRVSRGQRSVVCWLRPEEVGHLFRLWFIWVIVKLICSFRNHRLGMDGRVLLWFWMDGGNSWPIGKAVVVPGVGEEDVVVRLGSGAEWVSFLDSCLVGRVGELGENGMEELSESWKANGWSKVNVRVLTGGRRRRRMPREIIDRRDIVFGSRCWDFRYMFVESRCIVRLVIGVGVSWRLMLQQRWRDLWVALDSKFMEQLGVLQHESPFVRKRDGRALVMEHRDLVRSAAHDGYRDLGKMKTQSQIS